MVILHIADIDPSTLGGVPVAVPRMVLSQSEFAKVCLINLHETPVYGISVFSVGELMKDQLPAPFSRPDLAVFHEIYRPGFLPIARMLRKKGIPYIVVPHGGLTRQAQSRKKFKKVVANALLFAPFLKRAAAVQFLSRGEQERSLFALPCFVSGNGVQIPEVSVRKRDGSGCDMLYIGRLEIAVKGLDLLLEALSAEAEFLRSRNCRMRICGPDSEGAHAFLRNDSRRLGIEDIVSIHGPVTGEEKQKLLREADIFVQTSRSEGMPMGLLEALSMGIPCVVTSGTGLASMVESYGAGCGCETSVKSIAQGIHRAITDCRQDICRKGAVRLASEHFDCRKIAAEAVEHYREYCRK